MVRFRRLNASLAAVAAAWFLLAAPGAQAAPILPGFDLMWTPPGGAFLDLPLYTGDPTLPIVQLKGLPIGPNETDTIVKRNTGLGDGETGIIEAEIVALSLQSVAPVEIGGSFFDVFVTLDSANPSMGQLNVTEHNADGGLFDSFFDVFVKIDIVGPFTDQILAQAQLRSVGTPWSHTPPPNYPDDPNYPSGNFYITPVGIDHDGPHPRNIPTGSPNQVPEPATLLLFGFGLASFGVLRRRKAPVLA